jgi:hypothetical protein
MQIKVALLVVFMAASSACRCEPGSADAPSLSQGDHWKYQKSATLLQNTDNSTNLA